MAEGGIKESPLSRQVGKNAAYFNQYFERGTPKVLPEDVRDSLGTIFNLAPDSFKIGRRIPRFDIKPGPMILEEIEPLGRVVRSGAALLPDETMALIFQLDGGQEIAIRVDLDAVGQIRKNLSTIEHRLKSPELR